MKTILKISIILFTISFLSSCNLFKKDDNPIPEDTTPEYQKAIDAKFKSLGWDKDGHSKFNNSEPVKTTGGKGWVQYYAFGDRKTAIYYFGEKGAFAMDTEEMKKYDDLGQDNWGMVVSDPKPTKDGGCGYNEILRNDGAKGIITCQLLIDGDVYEKYKELNKWDGPLGLPVSSVLLTPAHSSDKGVFASFKNGTIWHTPTVGAVALWGKVLKLYTAVDYERSWLRYPKESCDPKKTDANQKVAFQNGSIGVGSDGKCGNYYDASGLSVLQNGTKGSPPCY
jgi:LGFP repeat